MSDLWGVGEGVNLVKREGGREWRGWEAWREGGRERWRKDGLKEGE